MAMRRLEPEMIKVKKRDKEGGKDSEFSKIKVFTRAVTVVRLSCSRAFQGSHFVQGDLAIIGSIKGFMLRVHWDREFEEGSFMN
jgi:hypothetical protein